jgi:hypothetical protein
MNDQLGVAVQLDAGLPPSALAVPISRYCHNTCKYAAEWFGAPQECHDACVRRYWAASQGAFYPGELSGWQFGNLGV